MNYNAGKLLGVKLTITTCLSCTITSEPLAPAFFFSELTNTFWVSRGHNILNYWPRSSQGYVFS